MKTQRQRDFLNRLADLCQEYEAEFNYTTNDDGIHIAADGSEVFVGFLFDAPAEFREAAAEDIWPRVAELLAQEGVPAQPQYREPTLEDALELIRANAERAPIEQLGTVRNSVLQALKQLGFVRKVTPNE